MSITGRPGGCWKNKAQGKSGFQRPDLKPKRRVGKGRASEEVDFLKCGSKSRMVGYGSCGEKSRRILLYMSLYLHKISDQGM